MEFLKNSIRGTKNGSMGVVAYMIWFIVKVHWSKTKQWLILKNFNQIMPFIKAKTRIKLATIVNKPVASLLWVRGASSFCNKVENLWKLDPYQIIIVLVN